MRSGTKTFLIALLAGLLAAPASYAGPTLLFDAGNGSVLYAEEPDDAWHPASLTKIMTAYVTFNAIREGKIKLDTKIPCSEAATLQPPSKIGLPVGAELTVETALQVLIVKSANDVAVMLAEAVGGSEAAFVEMMNATAKRLGMSRTHFVNPNGLPAPEQVTTARDLAKLARAVTREFPEYAGWWALPEVRVGKIRLTSHNGLLKTFEGADGLKTGFICDSGYNVVASATRDGRRLMAVVLGEATGHERTIRAASLLEYGFQQYGWKQLFNTVSIDSMPMDAGAKGPVSVRQQVISWECGTGRRRTHQQVAKAKKLRATTAALRAKASAGDKADAAKTEARKPVAAAAKKTGKTADAGTATGAKPAKPVKPAAQAEAASKDKP